MIDLIVGYVCILAAGFVAGNLRKDCGIYYLHVMVAQEVQGGGVMASVMVLH